MAQERPLGESSFIFSVSLLVCGSPAKIVVVTRPCREPAASTRLTRHSSPGPQTNLRVSLVFRNLATAPVRPAPPPDFLRRAVAIDEGQ